MLKLDKGEIKYMKDMLDKIVQIEKKYVELGQTLSDPDAVSYTHLSQIFLFMTELLLIRGKMRQRERQ